MGIGHERDNNRKAKEYLGEVLLSCLGRIHTKPTHKLLVSG
jgi:hypothetical protein